MPEGARRRMKDLPVDERPRERLLTHGAKVLSTAELLAVILRTGTKGESAVELARRVLRLKADEAREANGISGLGYLATVSADELMAVPGLGAAKVAQIKAVAELARRFAQGDNGTRVTASNPEEVARLLMPEMRYLEKEHFKAVLLNTKNHVIGVETISVGSLNSSIVHPREIFKEAIRRVAAAVILAHNHPSGDPTPSAEDIAVTRRLRRAGEILGIDVLDHIIIGDNEYVSLREQGVL